MKSIAALILFCLSAMAANYKVVPPTNLNLDTVSVSNGAQFRDSVALVDSASLDTTVVIYGLNLSWTPPQPVTVIDYDTVLIQVNVPVVVKETVLVVDPSFRKTQVHGFGFIYSIVEGGDTTHVISFNGATKTILRRE